jgi:TetR/AcrR family transcriptional regulator, mexJK operon transcriptional repressor
MNKRVHLPPDERREQIVRGALTIFAEKGFDATTNKEIARVAGIASPGLIYHYFQDKASLLRAVIEHHMTNMGHGPSPALIAALPSLPLEEGLRLFVRHFISEIQNPGFVAFTRVLMGEAMRRPAFAAILSEIIVSQMFNKVRALFESHIAQGNLRADLDPSLLTLRFVGAVNGIFIMREILQIPAVRALELQAIEDSLVEDFLKGIQP